MASSKAAEKQKRYRERRDADPARRAQYLQSKRDTFIRDKKSGLRKPISALVSREKRVQRKDWRKAQQRCRG